MENAKKNNLEANEKAFEKMKEEIEKINYGSVTAVIHEGKIVQLDTNIKMRLV